jgi:hypothetical protein
MRTLRFFMLPVFLTLAGPATAVAQDYTDLASFCQDMSEASTTALLVRIRGVPRSQAEAMMQGMTDPVSIRMVKEVIEFAYSRPATSSLDALRAELRNLCLAKKIFVQ